MAKPLIVMTVIFAVLSVFLLLSSGWALKQRRPVRTVANSLMALLLLSLAALFGTLSVATQGYRAFTREEVAAVITTSMLAPQRFQARVRFPDGRDTTFQLAGDEFYVDAHILKWKPLANVLGLHTDYELDRIAGRYLALEDEQSNPRTVFALSTAKPVNLFHLRRRYPILSSFVDAEYGSGTFIATDDSVEFEVRVSTTGLLIRKQVPSPS